MQLLEIEIETKNIRKKGKLQRFYGSLKLAKLQEFVWKTTAARGQGVIFHTYPFMFYRP